MFATCVEIPYSKYFYSLVFIYWFRSSKFPSLPSVKEKERGKQKQQRLWGREDYRDQYMQMQERKGGHSSTEVAFSPTVSLSAAPKAVVGCRTWEEELRQWLQGQKHWDCSVVGGIGKVSSASRNGWACSSGPPARRCWQGCRGQWSGS